MNKLVYRLASLVMALAMVAGNIVNAKAVGNVYYVSLTGNDTNPGTASAPFRTFAKANSVLTAGSTLYIYGGVYNEQLRITKSGTRTDRITVRPLDRAVIIDRMNAASAGLDIRASYVTVYNVVVRRSTDVCVNLTGISLTIQGLLVYNCYSHGIQANNASYINIVNNRILSTVLSNLGRTMPSGWGSAIKVRLSNYVLIQGNQIYNNYGEGIGARGTNITIRANTIYDNFSVNIYSNSENTVIERNFVYCTPNSGFERSGLPAVGIGLGEEYYPNWGARLINARVTNNIVAFCRNGVRYMGADAGVVGGGLKSATIAYNTLYGSTNAALSIDYESAQSGSLIANNIIWQAQNNLAAIQSPVGLTFRNNLWKVAPPAAFRGPGDRYGEPRFVTTPGYFPASYRPSESSPAASTAADIGVSHDFYATARGPMFDMGAIQFFDPTLSGSTQEMSSPTPVGPTATLPSATLLPATAQPTSTSAAVTPTPVEPNTVPPTATPTRVPEQTSPTATAQPLQQELTYDNKDSAFVYSQGWAEEVKAAAIGGSFARTSTNGASLTFQFTGQSFSVIYKGGPSYRKMDVYIDNVLVATIDERHDVSTYQARWDFPGQLSPGQHTLKLVFVTTSSSTNGSVDAVIVR